MQLSEFALIETGEDQRIQNTGQREIIASFQEQQEFSQYKYVAIPYYCEDGFRQTGMQILSFDEESKFPLIMTLIDSAEKNTEFRFANDLMKFGVRKIINNKSYDAERYYILSQAVLKEDTILKKVFEPSEMHYLMIDLNHTLLHMVPFQF